MTLVQAVAQQWDIFRRKHRNRQIKRILNRPFFSNYSCDEQSFLAEQLQSEQYYKRFLQTHKHLQSFTYPRNYNSELVSYYQSTGYCAHTLKSETIRAIRTSMDLYRRTGETRYFVRRFHKDILSSDISHDIVEYYWKKRHLTLEKISTILSEQYGIRIPPYQISRVARRHLPEFLWRRRRQN